MHDQVEALRRLGRLDVAALTSQTGADGSRAVLDALRDGAVRLLYVAPERFANARFRDALDQRRVSLLVVDEAHCLSEWGHDFRPDYGRLAAVRAALGTPPTMALTATATPQVAIDVARAARRLRDPVEVRTGFDRPNLTFDVIDGTGGDARAPRPAARRAGRARCAAGDRLRALARAPSRRSRDAASDCRRRTTPASPPAARRAAQDEFMASADARDRVRPTRSAWASTRPTSAASWHWNLPSSLEALLPGGRPRRPRRAAGALRAALLAAATAGSSRTSSSRPGSTTSTWPTSCAGWPTWPIRRRRSSRPRSATRTACAPCSRRPRTSARSSSRPAPAASGAGGCACGRSARPARRPSTSARGGSSARSGTSSTRRRASRSRRAAAASACCGTSAIAAAARRSDAAATCASPPPALEVSVEPRRSRGRKEPGRRARRRRPGAVRGAARVARRDVARPRGARVRRRQRPHAARDRRRPAADPGGAAGAPRRRARVHGAPRGGGAGDRRRRRRRRP